MMLKLTDDDFNRLVTYMKKNYGINLEKKRILIEGRLSNMVTARGFKDFKEFIDFAFADRSGNETMQLVNKLTTNHTFFLREPEHFDFLKSTVLPYIAKNNAAERSMNIWCAASSTGQEPYSIAMTIDEFFGADLSPHCEGRDIFCRYGKGRSPSVAVKIFRQEGRQTLSGHRPSQEHDKLQTVQPYG